MASVPECWGFYDCCGAQQAEVQNWMEWVKVEEVGPKRQDPGCQLLLWTSAPAGESRGGRPLRRSTVEPAQADREHDAFVFQWRSPGCCTHTLRAPGQGGTKTVSERDSRLSSLVLAAGPAPTRAPPSLDQIHFLGHLQPMKQEDVVLVREGTLLRPHPPTLPHLPPPAPQQPPASILCPHCPLKPSLLTGALLPAVSNTPHPTPSPGPGRLHRSSLLLVSHVKALAMRDGRVSYGEPGATWGPTRVQGRGSVAGVAFPTPTVPLDSGQEASHARRRILGPLGDGLLLLVPTASSPRSLGRWDGDLGALFTSKHRLWCLQSGLLGPSPPTETPPSSPRGLRSLDSTCGCWGIPLTCLEPSNTAQFFQHFPGLYAEGFPTLPMAPVPVAFAWTIGQEAAICKGHLPTSSSSKPGEAGLGETPGQGLTREGLSEPPEGAGSRAGSHGLRGMLGPPGEAGLAAWPGCPRGSDSSGFDALAGFEDPAPGSGLDQSPPSSEDSLPRNVASERSRRKRIATSCERLRALLPQFSDRREDMASVLEMAVQFLQLAHTLVPGWEQLTVPTPTKESWHAWQEEVLHLTLASQVPDSKRNRRGRAVKREPRRAPRNVEKTEATAALPERPQGADVPATLPERPPSLPEPHSPDSELLPWPVHSWPLASPGIGEEDFLGLPPLARDTESPSGPAEEAGEGSALVADARSLPGSGLEDGQAFLMTASAGWWQGSEHLKRHGGVTSCCGVQGPLQGDGGASPARGSPVDQAELGILGDPEPGSPELPDGSLELWSSDLGSWESELRDEADAIFPDFFT
ncbi:PREDICTED: spermatogenesis- and oogenesis-specific basic helix-loop-helix-containing protein 1 [Dipodomys ordii]|uniref:Spermatogenesis- and oogenesis-specific basic helix-loop-helix-containing protein 1 n=1 Tax=Dipodomys ordii TaxID=10020 RepID=A0A1S3G983_DIPOR|nr:PREDICTED: spermatogenesis- and oogenesis-specific basic helix-loop-helix-containing protein 1 [Dipodomys ordii]